MSDPIIKLAEPYFDFMAQRFPVMCASDEFHFIPRAQNAKHYYDRLDNLEADAISETITILQHFQKEFYQQTHRETDLENLIDLQMLMASVAGVLIALDKNRIWRSNPLFYLKIAFIGLDHALSKPASDSKEHTHRVLSRLCAVPGLLHQGIKNISRMPETFFRAAVEMVDDCRQYLHEILTSRTDPDSRNLSGRMTDGIENAGVALDQFKAFLLAATPIPDRRLGVQSFESSLKEHFLSIRDVDEIFQIAVEEWHHDLEQLQKLRLKIDPEKSWQELYHAFRPSDIEKMDTFSLYRREIDNMINFFSRHGVVTGDLNASLEFSETPTYLKSVRSAASFSAAFSDDDREKSIFYISPNLSRKTDKISESRLKHRLHREYKFLTAHETVPGHHFLDTVRRRLDNPVRRQIESPLFYEGWAFYAETLLTDFRYVHHPIEFLVDYKRRLWRSARCQIDVGLPSGFLNHEKAVTLLSTIGFSETEAVRQINRFQLNPGYQLCYSLGHYEIKQLKKGYESRMGTEQFHKNLLNGGELPFHLIEKRFKALENAR